MRSFSHQPPFFFFCLSFFFLFKKNKGETQLIFFSWRSLRRRGSRNISHIVFLSSIKFNSFFLSSCANTIFFYVVSGWMSEQEKWELCEAAGTTWRKSGTKTNEKWNTHTHKKRPSTNELASNRKKGGHNSSGSSQQSRPLMARWGSKTNVKRLRYSRSTLSVDYPLIYLPKRREANESL